MTEYVAGPYKVTLKLDSIKEMSSALKSLEEFFNGTNITIHGIKHWENNK